MLMVDSFLCKNQAEADMNYHGFGIQHVSDLVRLGSVADSGGFFVDGDVAMLRIPECTPTGSGYMSGSMYARFDARLSGTFRLLSYLKSSGDNVWLCRPWHFPKGSALCQALLGKVTELFARRRALGQCTTAVGYHIIMDEVKFFVLGRGLEDDILEPRFFHPVPHWQGSCMF